MLDFINNRKIAINNKKKNVVLFNPQKGKKYNDYSVSPVIRQGLQHWAYKLNLKDYNKHKKRPNQL